ncbi:MAG: carbon-nitrogen hydrolase family protein [Lachnospiraceae bacterium]|nr:carbon-nitrogen hydrolase family protein [Lachnospiraceae bacterium]
MKCALAAVGFINENITYNKKVIKDTMIKYAGKADIILFGEAFLQGFYGAKFDPEQDETMAIAKDDSVIKEICSVAKEYSIAVSFGFIEKEEKIFYSSQITIGAEGKVLDLYRRVSPGWKEEFAGERYCEGKAFHAFDFMEKKVAIGLCGDLWFDENIEAINALEPEMVFWPVYTDFNYEEWNTAVKLEYAEQAGKLSCKVLYVNSVCLDKDEEEIARGGAVLFENGCIVKEIPSGEENVLIVEV